MTPTANRVGTATITLTARDPDGAESTRTFLVTVFSVNEPPTLSAPSDLTIAEDAGPQTVNLGGHRQRRTQRSANLDGDRHVQ